MSEGEGIRRAETVERWFASARHDQAPDDVQERYLRILGDFCAHADKSPDELVAFCFLRKKDTGERFPSVKRRETVNGWIKEFAAGQPWEGKEAVVNANVIRGFFIHNAVVIQGPAWKGG